MYQITEYHPQECRWPLCQIPCRKPPTITMTLENEQEKHSAQLALISYWFMLPLIPQLKFRDPQVVYDFKIHLCSYCWMCVLYASESKMICYQVGPSAWGTYLVCSWTTSPWYYLQAIEDSWTILGLLFYCLLKFFGE